MDNKKFVVIRSYSRVWKIESRIYAIGKLVLPIPIVPREIGFFTVFFLIVFLLGLLVKPLLVIPSFLRLGVLPFFLSQFFSKMKLDGKSPHKYLISWLQFIFTKNEYLERFQAENAIDKENIKLQWLCSKGREKNV